MEAIQFIADNPDISTSPLLSIAPLLAAALPGAISGAVSGLAGIAQGIFGGRKRREEQRAAAAELRNRTSQYENFQFQNFYAGLENPYEDLTVNTQAADFAAQQQQQGLANTLDTLRQSGGGLGAAALAQSLASIQSQNLQQASASIAQQEAANARMAAQGEMSLQMAEAGGAANVQAQEFGRNETLLGIAAGRKSAADKARQQASSAFFGGVGNLAGAAAAFGAAGGFKAAPTAGSTDYFASTREFLGGN